MKEIVFTTNNAHKLSEMREIIGNKFKVLSLADIGCHEDIPETALTIEGNSMIKARYVKDKYGFDCFSDDTGLEIDALGGEPGVYSARYAGPEHDSEKNIDLVLSRLDGKDNRNAHFRTVITLIMGDDVHTFEGVVMGKILTERHGQGGFGYDSVFRPDEGDGRTFAQMTSQEKNAISHRGRATRALIDYLIKL